MSAAAPTRLPPLLADNPRLDRWVGFPVPGPPSIPTRIRGPAGGGEPSQ